MRADLIVPDVGHTFIGGQHQQHIAGGGGLRNLDGFPAFGYCEFAVFVLAVADDRVDAAVAQVERLRPPLIAVTENGDSFAVQCVHG